MNKSELVIGTMLIYNSTGEPFRISGLNTKERDNGTLKKVVGIFRNGACYNVYLKDCSLSTDMSLMY